MHKLVPLLSILAQTWDPQKYSAGVDAQGAARADQQKAQERAEATAGLSKFEPERISKAVRNPLFHAYTHMISLVETVPEKLALDCESCVCHEPLLKTLSSYRKAKLLGKHFDGRMTSCPMAGKLAPELVTGRLLETFTSVWDLQECELHVAETYGRTELTPADRQVFNVWD